MFHRLRNDFRLSVLTVMSSCGVLGITPFAVWRMLRQEWLIAAIDLGILAGILTGGLYAWRTGDTDRAGFVLASVVCAGGMPAALILGEVGLFWFYPAMLVCYLLTSPRIALVLTSLSLLIVASQGSVFDSAEQQYSFVVTVLMICACAYVFGRNNELQRLRLEQLAIRDPLTGVKNRRSMDEELQLAVAGYHRNQLSYGLALMDLDHFKIVNDKHGHAVGDRVLLDFVAIIEASSRRVDQLFRFGGEEFVLLLPGVDREGLARATEQLQRVVRQNLKSPSGPVTASFGLALLEDSDDSESWLWRADRALYQAKAQGRDCIVFGAKTDDAPGLELQRGPVRPRC